MKILRHTKLILAGCLFWTAVGCEEFIAVDTPQSELTTPAVFENIATADAAMADIYARMRENGMVNGTFGGLSSLMSNYADEMDYYDSNIEIKQFNNHTIVPSNSLILALWNETYGEIYAANLILEGIENSVLLSDGDWDRLKGEALFLRAFLHFYLVNLFGDVPYATVTDYTVNTTISKTPALEVWQKLTDDLVEAETLLPVDYPTAGRFRANKAVATAMLARVYLYREDWQNAASKAGEVIDNPAYTWVTDPAGEFLRVSTATILSLHPGFPGVNTKDARTFLITTGPPTKPALANAFVNAFETGDQRKTKWVRTITNGANTWYCSFKYKKPLGTPVTEECTILFRLAEQYLIRAEAKAHLADIGGAQADINKIRNRAGLSDTPAGNEATLLQAVAKERRFEFFTEQGHRWLDLKRTGKAAEVLSPVKPGWENTQVLLPLPENELLLNSNLLPQNPGY